MKEFLTTDIKLSAFLLAEVPQASFRIPPVDSPKKSIIICYPSKFEKYVIRLVREFINCEAKASLYSYNKYLNLIRDQIKGRKDV